MGWQTYLQEEELSVHRETREWTVRMLTDFQSRIRMDNEFQRSVAWSSSQQTLFMDSILRGFDIPKIFLRKIPDGGQHLFSVIDGKQRLTAIWRFLNDEIPLLRTFGKYPDCGDLGGMRWSEMPENAQNRLQFTSLTVSKIKDASDDDIRELLLRLQEGETLNAAEKRNAASGPIRDFVANELATHKLWPQTGISRSRLGWHEHSAIVLTLVQQDGPAGVKGADLQRLYDMSDFEANGPVATRAIEVLDRLEHMTRIKQECVRTRWAVVDLSTTLLRLSRENRSVSLPELVEFFESFEEKRRFVSQTVSDLQSGVVGQTRQSASGLDQEELESLRLPSDMVHYHMAFVRDGANQENVGKRSEIIYRRLLEFLGSK